jgi:hypothetical protein
MTGDLPLLVVLRGIIYPRRQGRRSIEKPSLAATTVTIGTKELSRLLQRHWLSLVIFMKIHIFFMAQFMYLCLCLIFSSPHMTEG